MLRLDAYLLDPCGTSSIPFWKTKTMAIPAGLQILHSQEPEPICAEGFRDEVYFRLRHDLMHTAAPSLPHCSLRTICQQELELICAIINCAYTELQITLPQLQGYTRTPVYAPDLWVLAQDETRNEAVGCALADFDPETGEMSLEWIQVLPQYRHRGFGRAMVMELLHRKPSGARFATVSGRVSTRWPEALYRSCGFTGQDYWHILSPEVT